MFLRILCICVAFIMANSAALAYNFTAAKNLFRQRSVGNTVAEKIMHINAARAEFRRAIPSVSGAERIYLYEMLARLSYYEGLLVTNEQQQKAIYVNCMNEIDNIQNTASPQYYYWKATCLASWGKANGVMASLRYSRELEDLCLKGIRARDTYEGGGFYRILSAVYLNLPAINPFGPRGDVNKALQMANRAIASPADVSEEHPSTASGDYFYAVYEFKAEILIKLGRRAEAKSLLAEELNRINHGDLPVGKEPETMEQKKTLQALYNSI